MSCVPRATVTNGTFQVPVTAVTVSSSAVRHLTRIGARDTGSMPNAVAAHGAMVRVALACAFVAGCSAASPSALEPSAPTPFSPTPSLTHVPATLDVTPAATGDWVEIGFDDQIDGLRWSTTGQYLAVAYGPPAGSSAAQRVGIYTANGDFVQLIEGADDLVWLSDHSFVVTSFERRRDASGLYEVVATCGGGFRGQSDLMSIGDPTRQALDVDLGLGVASQTGAVAFHSTSACDPLRPQTAIWTPETGDVSPRVDGHAMQWSPDGTRLLVVHPVSTNPSTQRWPEVVSWPELDTVYSDGDRDGFTPNGDWTATAYGDDPAVDIVPLDGGEATSFFAQSGGGIAWDSAGNVLVDDFATGSVSIYRTDGSPVDHLDSVGDSIAYSADATLAVAWYSAQPDLVNDLTLIQSGHAERLRILGQMTSFRPVLAPNGAGVACIASVDKRETLLVHQR